MDPELITSLFEKDNFARENRIRIVEVRLGYAQAHMHVEARHMNAAGMVQGGTIATLADFALARHPTRTACWRSPARRR